MESLALLVRHAKMELVFLLIAQEDQVQVEVQDPKRAVQIMESMMDLPPQVVMTGMVITQVRKARAAEVLLMGPLQATALPMMGHRLAVHKDKALVVMTPKVILTQDPVLAQDLAPAMGLLVAQMTVEALDLARTQEAELARATDQIQDRIHPQAMVQELDLREAVVQDQMVEMATAMAQNPAQVLVHHQAMDQTAVEMDRRQHANQHLRLDHKAMFLVVVAILMQTIPPLVLLIQDQMADRPRAHKLEPVQAKVAAKEVALEAMDLEATTDQAVAHNQRLRPTRLEVQREVVQAVMATLCRVTLCPMVAQKQHRALLYLAALHLQERADRELQVQQARHRQLLSYLMGHQLSTPAQTQQMRLEDW
jgi:hypothetical protein